MKKYKFKITSDSGNSYIYFPDISLFLPEKNLKGRISWFIKDNLDKLKYYENNIFNKNFLGNSDFEKQFYNLHLFTIEITQNCNLRCGYCPYTGVEEEYNYTRIHNSSKMHFHTYEKFCKMIIPLLNSNKRTRNFSNIFIGFYGGEPLLEKELLIKMIEYAENYVQPKIKDKIIFVISSNGTLFDVEFVDKIIDKNLFTMLSIDGPESEHDKERKFANNKGSFSQILNNLENIKKKYPDFIKERIAIQGVISEKYNYKKISSFFNTFDVPLSRLSNYARLERFDTAIIRKLHNKTSWIYSSYINKKKSNKKVNHFEKVLISPNFEKFFKRSLPFTRKVFDSGLCSPMNFRCFLKPNEKIAICERIGEGFEIGDVDNGINVDIVKETYKMFWNTIKNKCDQCIARGNCGICFARISDNGVFDKKNSCEAEKKIFYKSLKDYISVLERNPNAFYDESKKLNKINPFEIFEM